MKKILIISFFVLITNSAFAESEYDFKCQKITAEDYAGVFRIRCENKEAICYYGNDGKSCIKK